MNVWIVWYREDCTDFQEEGDCALTLCRVYSTKEGAERGKTDFIVCDADTHASRSSDRYFVSERRVWN